MYIIGRVGGTSTINGHIQAQKTRYAPPPRQKDADRQRFAAQAQPQTQAQIQTQTGAQQPAVRVTLSPEAQKALAAQKTQQSSASGS